MGCSNSHLRPLFRRCRGKGSKKDGSTSSGQTNSKGELIEENHADNASSDLIQGFNFLGSSMRNTNKPNNQSIEDAITSDPNAPYCVPLLAQSVASSSQIDFFKMLDEKIEDGPDYYSDDEHGLVLCHRPPSVQKQESIKSHEGDNGPMTVIHKDNNRSSATRRKKMDEPCSPERKKGIMTTSPPKVPKKYATLNEDSFGGSERIRWQWAEDGG